MRNTKITTATSLCRSTTVGRHVNIVKCPNWINDLQVFLVYNDNNTVVVYYRVSDNFCM